MTSQNLQKFLNVDINVWGLVVNYDKCKIGHSVTRKLSESCPICADKLHPAIRMLDDENNTVLEKSYCETCSFLTYTQMPSQEWFDEFYASAWDQSRSTENIEKKFVPLYQTTEKMLLPRLKSKDAHVMDYGCGYGNFLYEMRKQGYKNLTGFEYSEKRAEYTRSLGLEVCTVEALSQVGDASSPLYQNVDAIHCNHVFEHVYDVNKTLKFFRHCLKDQGVLFLAVPNLSQEHIFEALHFLPHIHHFTKENLSFLLQKNGFEIVEAIDEVAVVARKLENPVGNGNNQPVKPFDLGLKVLNDLNLDGNKLVGKKTLINITYKNAKPETRVDTENQNEMKVLKHVLGNDSHGRLTAFKTLGMLRLLALKLFLGFDENNVALTSLKAKLQNIIKPKIILNKVGRRIFSNDRRIFGSLFIGESQNKYPLVQIRYSDGECRGWLK